MAPEAPELDMPPPGLDTAPEFGMAPCAWPPGATPASLAS